MKRLRLHAVCSLLLAMPVCGAERQQLLFGVSPSGQGEIAVFSKKALFDRNENEKFRFGAPIQFEVDAIKIWTFEGDGDRVTMYTVGIAGTFKNEMVGSHVLLKRGGDSYLGQTGNAGAGATAIKGIDELYLEPGQSYITFQLRDKNEAIAVAHDLASLLK